MIQNTLDTRAAAKAQDPFQFLHLKVPQYHRIFMLRNCAAMALDL